MTKDKMLDLLMESFFYSDYDQGVHWCWQEDVPLNKHYPELAQALLEAYPRLKA